MAENYYLYSKDTHEVNHTPFSVFNGSKMAEYPSTALTITPLEPKEGYVVIACEFDEHGKPHDTRYIEDHRGKTIYDKLDCTKSEIVSELGPIKSGFTLDEPLTEFDEWINDGWVTNLRNKYIADYDAVDNTRRVLYREISDPLYMESYRKKENGQLEEAAIFKAQGDAAVEDIQAKHPFPLAPVI